MLAPSWLPLLQHVSSGIQSIVLEIIFDILDRLVGPSQIFALPVASCQVQKLQFPVVNSTSDPDPDPTELGPGALQAPSRALPVPDPAILTRAAESGRSEDSLQGK